MILVGMTMRDHAVYTDLALRSLWENTKGDFRTIVIDDGSSERYVPQAEWKDPFAVVANTLPVGVIAVWNQLVDFWQADEHSDHLLITNNDVIFFPGWDGAMVGCFSDHPDCGIVGPLTNKTGAGHQPEQGPGSDKISEFAKLAREPVKQMDRCVEYVNGFCFMLQKDRLIGDGTETFLGHPAGELNFGGEDDYQERMRANGLRAYMAAGAFVYHFKDVTMGTAEQGRLGMRPDLMPARLSEYQKETAQG